MSIDHAGSRTGTTFRWAVPALLAGATASAVAFVFAPGPVAAGLTDSSIADRRSFREAVHTRFVDYWVSGNSAMPADFKRVVDYWFAYHLTKAVAAAVLVVALSALVHRAYKAYVAAGSSSKLRRWGLVGAIAAVSTFAFSALLVLMANIQGSVAPFASLFPTLLQGPTDEPLARVLGEVQEGLAAYSVTSSPVLESMVQANVTFHVTVAMCATAAGLGLAALAAKLWFGRSPLVAAFGKRAIRVRRTLGAVPAVLAIALVLIAVGNVTVAADPAPPLLAFFDGGW